MRSRLGTSWSVPWQHTDLPALTPPVAPRLPLLSPQAPWAALETADQKACLGLMARLSLRALRTQRNRFGGGG